MWNAFRRGIQSSAQRSGWKAFMDNYCGQLGSTIQIVINR